MGHRRMVQRMQTYDLTHPQFVTLASLVAHKVPVSMGELTEVTLQDAPTMTRIVDRLVNMALVYRTRNEQDRRLVLVGPTQAGQTLIETIQHDLDQEDAFGFCAMDDEALTKLEDFLDHILAAYLKKTYQNDAIDLESVKQELRNFVLDPITFIRTRKQNP